MARPEGRALRRAGGGGRLLLAVLVLPHVTTRGHKGLVLVYLGGSFLLRESDYFFFQKSPLLLKPQLLLLVDSLKVFKLGLEL